ncbi:MAG: MFS transporter [Pseudomonadota bacterium]
MLQLFNKRDPENWVSISLVSFLGVIALTPFMILPVLVFAYDKLLGFGPDNAGRVSSAALAGIAITTIFVALNAKHWPLAKVSRLGMTMVLIFKLIALWVHSLWLFALLVFLAGLGSGFVQASVAAALARTENPERAFGIYIGWQFALTAIGFLWFPDLINGQGFTSFLSGYNAMAFVILILSALAWIITPVLSSYRLPASEDGKKLEISLICQRPALLSTIGIMFFGAAIAALFAYAEGIVNAAGLDVIHTGEVLAYATAASVFGSLVVIWLQDKIGHYIPVTFGIIIQLICIYVLLNNASSIVYAVAFSGFSIALAFTWPYFLSIQADIDNTGTVTAFGQFANMAGTALGPLTAASFVGAGGDYVRALGVACLFLVFAFFAIVLVKITLNKSVAA